MTSVLPLTLGKSDINFDNSASTGILTLNGTSVTEIDVTNIPPVRSLTWNDLYNLRDNLTAVGNAPNTTTLRVENTIRLTDNLGNTRNISTLSNPATTIDIAQTDASGLYYPVFTDVNGSAKSLLVDNAVGPLSYNPNTSTLTATRFNGTATQLNVVGSNVNQERPITVINSTTGGDRALVIDSQTNNFAYNVSLQRMSVNNIRTYGTISSPNNIIIDPTNILTVQGDTEIFGQLDMENNNIVNCPQVRNNAGNIEIKANSTGVGGTISLTAGTDLLSATSGGSAGLHLKLTINGTAYKIALLNV